MSILCSSHDDPQSPNTSDYVEPPESFRNYVSNISSLPVDQASQLLDLLLEYRSIFQKQPGFNKLYTCNFDVSDDNPFKICLNPAPFARRPVVEKEFQRMLEWGIIDRCSSPYGNPILCVGKADGTVRLSLDARKINKVILPMRDSSPPLDELLARFSGKTMFSSLDFMSGYWQIPLHQNVRKFTAFVHNGWTYQFCVVLFGWNVMRELERFFRTYCRMSHTDWPQYVKYVEWVLNNTIHESTGFTPEEIFLKGGIILSLRQSNVLPALLLNIKLNL